MDVNFWHMVPRDAVILAVLLRVVIATYYSAFAIRQTLITSFHEYAVVYATPVAQGHLCSYEYKAHVTAQTMQNNCSRCWVDIIEHLR